MILACACVLSGRLYAADVSEQGKRLDEQGAKSVSSEEALGPVAAPSSTAANPIHQEHGRDEGNLYCPQCVGLLKSNAGRYDGAAQAHEGSAEAPSAGDAGVATAK